MAKFCSNSCQGEYQQKERFNKWLNGEYSPSSNVLRLYVKKLRGEKCENCGLSEWMNSPITLEVDHIDGNYKNNNPDNTKLLCPNCHSITPTYKGKNKGNGRHKRMVRYKANLSY